MRLTVLALLLLGLLAFAAMIPVRADDDGDDDSSSESSGEKGSGDEEAEAPKPKAEKPAKKPVVQKLEELPLEAISKLPVEPLSMDAAALKDDDRNFDMLPKGLSGEENVAQLGDALTKATTLLRKMQRDVESEKVWTKNVYDIIQNYQYKYLKTVRDVKERETKIAKLENLVKMIKQSTLHASVQRELTKASKQLKELVTRSGGDTELMGRYYKSVNDRMTNLKNQLREMPRPTELYSETTAKMKSIMKNRIPPKTADAIKELTGDEEEEEEAKPAAKPAKKPSKKRGSN